MGIGVLGFGLSTGNSYTWAMVISAELGAIEDDPYIDDLVWDSWANAVAEYVGGHPQIDEIQRMIADLAIHEIDSPCLI